MDQVVILARGLGTRMRKSDPAVALDPALAAAADSGVKAMIPIGRPFLDYVLGVAADAGITRACLVVGPEHGQMQKYYTELRPRRMTIEFAVQVQPLGTADAVAAAEQVVGQRPFVMINSDNYYPLQALCGLRDAPGPAVAIFDQETLVAESNIAAERISKFAVVEGDYRGRRLPALAADHREARRSHAGPAAAAAGREHELLALRPGHLRGLPPHQAFAARRVGSHRRRAVCDRPAGRAFRHRVVQGPGAGPLQPQRHRTHRPAAGGREGRFVSEQRDYPMQLRHDIRSLSRNFQIFADFQSAEPYGTGHINDTYAATYRQGGATIRYIHQRINQNVFKNAVGLMENVQRVTDHLRAKLAGQPDVTRRALTLVPARDGRMFFIDPQGECWRTYVFIEDARTYDAVESTKQAYEAAKAFGRFQGLLADLPAPRLHDTIPDFHNTPKRFAALEKAIEADAANRAASGPGGDRLRLEPQADHRRGWSICKRRAFCRSGRRTTTRSSTT